MASELFRIEHALVGDRLVPVATPGEATHVAVSLVRRLSEERTAEAARLRAELEQAALRVKDLEVRLGRAIHRVDQAESAAAQVAQEAEHLRERVGQQQDAIGKLAEKNAEVIGEKRTLRNSLIAKHGLPAISYRIDIDRENRALETTVIVLDTLPHRERTVEALTEARRQAQRHNGRLRALRLDTAAWRAIVQVPIGT